MSVLENVQRRTIVFIAGLKSDESASETQEILGLEVFRDEKNEFQNGLNT